MYIDRSIAETTAAVAVSESVNMDDNMVTSQQFLLLSPEDLKTQRNLIRQQDKYFLITTRAVNPPIFLADSDSESTVKSAQKNG